METDTVRQVRIKTQKGRSEIRHRKTVRNIDTERQLRIKTQKGRSE